MFSKLRHFLPLAVVITCMCLLVYGAVQQNFRQEANDPQIQISEDMANNLKDEARIPTFASSKDISVTLSPFVMVFDDKKELSTSEAILDSKPPVLPSGVLDFAKKYQQARVTWQPKSNVRIAAVVTYYTGKNSGYVLAGRSLREVEIREDNLQRQVVIAWIFTMVASFIATLIFLPTLKKN